MLADGRTTTATTEYLRESILDPGAKVVATYPPSMPGYRGQLTDGQLGALVRYIESLKGIGGPSAAAMASGGAAVDPVCGMSIHAGPGTPHASHDGHTVYFCSEHCRAAVRPRRSSPRRLPRASSVTATLALRRRLRPLPLAAGAELEALLGDLLAGPVVERRA